MKTILKVSLNQSVAPPRLEVNEKEHPIPRHHDKQIIRWKLIKHAANGSFNSQGQRYPGFAWVPVTPPEGIFGVPTREPSNKELTMSDLNKLDGTTTGDWTYQLSATIDGMVRQSDPRSFASETTNPSESNQRTRCANGDAASRPQGLHPPHLETIMSMTGNDNQNAPLSEDDENRESSRQPAPDFEGTQPPPQPNAVPRIKNT